VFRELCRWEVGVGLGWLPMTGRHLYIACSLIRETEVINQLGLLQILVK
jgi:hypothetical protein